MEDFRDRGRGRGRRLALTETQAEMLGLIARLIRSRPGVPPTVRELMAASGRRSPRSPHQLLAALERKGFVRRGRVNSGRRPGARAPAPRGLTIACNRDGNRLLLAGQWYEFIGAEDLEGGVHAEAKGEGGGRGPADVDPPGGDGSG